MWGNFWTTKFPKIASHLPWNIFILKKQTNNANEKVSLCKRLFLCLLQTIIFINKTFLMTNQSHFSMVYTLIDHRNDVRKCSKLKGNHEPCKWFHCIVKNVLWNLCFSSGLKRLLNHATWQVKLHVSHTCYQQVTTSFHLPLWMFSFFMGVVWMGHW